MGTQWENFLQNLGEWRGSFTSLNADGVVEETTPSLLILERGDDERLVHFRLRRYAAGDDSGVPTREVNQEYRSLGRQVVFFDSGSFSKGSLQVAPGTAFGAEFGFVVGDRRHRLVQLHNPEGAFQNLVLIREFREGSGASECPPLELEMLLGRWSGRAATISADWSEADTSPCELVIEGGEGGGGLGGTSEGKVLRISSPLAQAASGVDGLPQRLLPLADAGYSLAPQQVSHRQAFAVEAGWLPAPGRLERLIRRYDASGAWLASTHIIAEKSD